MKTLRTRPSSPSTPSTKNTRSEFADSRNTPGAMRDTSSLLSSLRRYSWARSFDHGERNNPRSALSRMIGAAKTSTGRTQAKSDTPAADQTTISESL